MNRFRSENLKSHFRHWAILLLLGLAYPVSLQSQTKDPILRIETGSHNGTIRRISVDAAEKFLVTGSEDKTVRVWELSTGKQLKIFRPPMGSGREGGIYAVAISPDGKTILCSGHTGWDWEQEMYLYVLDRERGTMIRRLKGIPEVVHDIKFSEDGKYFGVAFEWGVQLYRSSDYSLIAADTTYREMCRSINFYLSSYLLTVAYDGNIRLYDLTPFVSKDSREKNFYPSRMEPASSGNKPSSCDFSSDGSLIAIGYMDSKNVDIFSGPNSSAPLDYVRTADVSGIHSGNLGLAVAWSKDGSALYAGGTYYKSSSGTYPIRKWSDAGRGRYTDIEVCIEQVGQIVALRDNGVAISELGRSFGVLDSRNSTLWYQSSAAADFRSISDALSPEGFLISYDGSSVQFGYKVFGEDPARFLVKSRNLEYPLGSAQTEALQPPITVSNTLRVTNWLSNTPMLDSMPLPLVRGEEGKCLAIAPDKESFVLGTGYYLRSYDFLGTLKWTYLMGPTWGVNFSGNNKIAVAALDDGTIRWFRMWDGQELLSFYPHSDRKRWVLWTPSGYYDVSPGGEDLIGWHINNGKDSVADFFTVSRFRETYYRPDIVAKVLDLLDESAALRDANKELGKTTQEISVLKRLPPVVSILSPQDGAEISSTEVTVRYSIRSPSGEPIKNVRVLVDGRPIEARGAKFSKDISDRNVVKILVPEKDCEISIFAENQFAPSEEATVRLVWKGKQQSEVTPKSKLYLLSIGVSRYDNEDLRLTFPSKDARDFAQTMRNQKGKLYSDVIQKVLVDEKATRASILEALEWIEGQTKREDVAMIFLTGHGWKDPSHRDFYFLPVDFNPYSLRSSGVPFTEFKRTVSRLKGNVVIFVDACHAADIMGSGLIDVTKVGHELTSEENGEVVLFASSKGNQLSLEDSAWNNSAFTRALIDGLEGEAPTTQKGEITPSSLSFYLGQRVPKLAEEKQKKQTPVLFGRVSDFPLAIK